MSKATDIGRQGEFLAAYILETHGVEVHHVDRARTRKRQKKPGEFWA